MADRTVHAAYPGMEIVRYDRAGKWYLEATGDGYVDAELLLKRRQVGVRTAARLAIDQRARWFPGRPGGQMFDRKMRDSFDSQEPSDG